MPNHRKMDEPGLTNEDLLASEDPRAKAELRRRAKKNALATQSVVKTARQKQQPEEPPSLEVLAELTAYYNLRYETLELDTLQVARYDPNDNPIEWYQRDEYDQWVHRIMVKYNPLYRTPGLVGIRKDGSRWIVDGAHHTKAEKNLGLKNGVFRVFDSPGYAFEAHVFSECNRNTKRITPLEMFNADVTNNFGRAAEIKEMLTKYGFKVGKNKNREEITAVAWLRNAFYRYSRVWALDGVEYTSFELGSKIIREIYGGQREALSDVFIAGIPKFLNDIAAAKEKKDPGVAVFEFNLFLSMLRNPANTPTSMDQRTRTIAETRQGVFRVNAMSITLEELFNRGIGKLTHKQGALRAFDDRGRLRKYKGKYKATLRGRSQRAA